MFYGIQHNILRGNIYYLVQIPVEKAITCLLHKKCISRYREYVNGHLPFHRIVCNWSVLPAFETPKVGGWRLPFKTY